LLVEDDEVDAMTVNRAFTELKITNKLVHRLNGEDALKYLKDDVMKPCVILLDLNMPRMNDFDFLKIIKTDNNLIKIPVVVLTTSTNDQDVVESFNFNVAGYIVKPVNYKNFVDSMRTVNTYWTLSELPNGD